MINLKNYIFVCNSLPFASVFCSRKCGFTVINYNNLSKFYSNGIKLLMYIIFIQNLNLMSYEWEQDIAVRGKVKKR
jgi:hypothetical protein